jgi:hypothetical protein
MPPKKNNIIKEETQFLCLCGQIIKQKDRSSHICTVANRAKTKVVSVFEKSSEAEQKDLIEKRRLKEKIEQDTFDISKAKRLHTLNYELKFGTRGQLKIVLQQKGPDQETPITIECDVIDDRNLSPNSYVPF